MIFTSSKDLKIELLKKVSNKFKYLHKTCYYNFYNSLTNNNKIKPIP